MFIIPCSKHIILHLHNMGYVTTLNGDRILRSACFLLRASWVLIYLFCRVSIAEVLSFQDTFMGSKQQWRQWLDQMLLSNLRVEMEKLCFGKGYSNCEQSQINQVRVIFFNADELRDVLGWISDRLCFIQCKVLCNSNLYLPRVSILPIVGLAPQGFWRTRFLWSKLFSQIILWKQTDRIYAVSRIQRQQTLPSLSILSQVATSFQLESIWRMSAVRLVSLFVTVGCHKDQPLAFASRCAHVVGQRWWWCNQAKRSLGTAWTN